MGRGEMPTIRVHFAWAAVAMLSAATAAPAQAACYPMAGIEPLSSSSPREASGQSADASSSNGSFHGAEFPKRGARKWMPKVFERLYRSSYTGRLDTWLEFTVIS